MSGAVCWHSCELLASSDLPLAKVATRVGYRTQAHFTGVFHRHVGVTPRTYRVTRSEAATPSERRTSTEGEEEERAPAPPHGAAVGEAVSPA